MSLYNVYCDESCHLINDRTDIMVLGCISCPADQSYKINEDIRKIKQKHNLSRTMEIKWVKVSEGKVGFYSDLIDYFFDNPCLSFRGVVATQKNLLDHEAYNQTHDQWYYKMYYLLLRHIVDIGNEYKIYLDIKDTNSADKVKNLHNILSRSLLDFFNETIRRVQNVRSDEIEVLQLADLIIGAISYENRGLSTSKAKCVLVEQIKRKSGTNLKYKTPLKESKFNLFVWEPGR